MIGSAPLSANPLSTLLYQRVGPIVYQEALVDGLRIADAVIYNFVPFDAVLPLNTSVVVHFHGATPLQLPDRTIITIDDGRISASLPSRRTLDVGD